MSETKTKRSFYNAGDNKGFTKAIFFQSVLAIANGEEVEEDIVEKVAAAAAYELDGIATRANKAAGDRKDPLDSDYAVALKKALLPLLTEHPQTMDEIVEKATAKGSLSPKGKPWALTWAYRVFNAAPEVVKVEKIVDKVDAKGLKSQTVKAAYIKA